jgi:hypothetical protein
LLLLGSFRAFGFTRADEVSTRAHRRFHGERIVEIPCFSRDLSISAHEYAWHKTTRNVAMIGGDVPLVVARTIEDFLTYYLDEPKRMFG